MAPRSVGIGGHLSRLGEKVVLQNQAVEVCGDEAAVGVFRAPDDRLAPDVEARIQHHRASRTIPKATQEPIEATVALRVDRLHRAV